MPTSSVNRVVNVPGDVQPIAKQTSVTLRPPLDGFGSRVSSQVIWSR
jgi:hypothetical protein